MLLHRRSFIEKGTLIAASFVGLRRYALLAEAQSYRNEIEGYGSLIEDPHGIFDLPPGFRYTLISRTGDFMSDGLRTPGMPDGMAAFPGPDSAVVVVRNHELTRDQVVDGAFDLNARLLDRIDRSLLYDEADGIRPHLGGTTTVVYDPAKREILRHFLSLAGTSRNCAGGPTPWNTWITCEESVESAGNGNLKNHGYNFEVPASPEPSLATPRALEAMGRFNHEAIAVDPQSGVVYQTEDRGDGLFYRFIPNTRGRLEEGGRLQALVIRDKSSCDTRNWETEQSAGDSGRIVAAERTETFPVSRQMAVRWIDLDEVDAPKDDLRHRGFFQGAAVFARGEGAWYGNESVYFACTNGGAIQKGQVFRYRPSPHEGTAREEEQPGTIELFVESSSPSLLEYCDNLTVAPWGDVVICEDGPDEQYIRGVSQDGRLYTIAKNGLNRSELTGVCFAPDSDHPTMFVNIQRPGITLAITGPWNRKRS